MRNIDKIKNMTLDEMAEFIKCSDCYYCPVSCCEIWKDNENYTEEKCYKYTKQWLQQESENND